MLTQALRLNFRKPSAIHAVEYSLSRRTVAQFAFLVVATDEIEALVAIVAAAASHFAPVAALGISIENGWQGSAFDVLVDDVDGGDCGVVDGRLRGSSSSRTPGDAVGGRTVASTGAVGFRDADGNAALDEDLGLWSRKELGGGRD